MKHLLLLLTLLIASTATSYAEHVTKYRLYKSYDSVIVGTALDDNMKNHTNNATLQKKIEAELRRNGIPVTDMDEATHRSAYFTFSVAVQIRANVKICAFQTESSVLGNVTLNNGDTALVPLHNRATFGTVDITNIYKLTGNYEEYLYKFINDWQKAHPTSEED
jgi:hypothetical protein